jgi:acetyl-CoA synthetase
VASSAGEPLNAELLEWSARELGVSIHDHYGQSELGMVVGFPHHPELRVEPIAGSMGPANPGFTALVLDDDGNEVGPGVDGELAIDVESSPLYWFRGYYDDPERTAERFRHGPGRYLTADAAQMDERGLLHFASRADDVITSSGYRIGPFEIESALMAHAAVAEVAVIGTPDDLRGEAVTAFVVTAPAVQGTPELAQELQELVKARLAKHLYPRYVLFVEALPRTPSGKVQRRVLREQSGALMQGGPRPEMQA